MAIATRVTFDNLRQYLDRLAETGDLLAIDEEVDPAWEVGTICREALDRRGPGLLFRRVRGYETPLATNLFGTRERYAAGLGLPADIHALRAQWRQAFTVPIKPQVVTHAPCKEVITTDVDLTRDPFPVPVWHARDGGPMLGTLHGVITRDPESGWLNSGVYRNQVLSPTTLGCNAPPTKDLQIHWRKYRDLGRPMPVAIAVGLDPYLCLVGCTSVPHQTDEYDVAGGLKGAPIDVVPAELSDLLVPAQAEIVIEGIMRTDIPTVEEGPFGEFTGYLGAAGRCCPPIEVQLVSYRRDPIFHGALEGRGPSEGTTIKSISKSVSIFDQLDRAGALGVVNVCVTEPGCGSLHAVVAIQNLYSGHARDICYQVWAMPGSIAKHVTVVDADVDPWDPYQVEYAVATTVQARRDIEIVRGRGTFLDPAVPPSLRGWTDLMGIDATRPVEYYQREGAEFPPSNQPPDEWLQRVRDRWTAYGFRR
jgi:UbiD family decarboxylase